MNWFIRLLTSSIGQKIVMSLTGLFLMVFLIVHLAGNLQLLSLDLGESFNSYAVFMTTNPIIKTVSYGLYAMILLHAIQGIALWIANRKAAGAVRYAKKASRTAWGPSWISSNMAWFGILIFAFLLLHMGDFWWAMKMDLLETARYTNMGAAEMEVNDLYRKVYESFKQEWIVLAYLVGLFALAAHLWHGFASAFQTLGLNHPKYMPLIKAVGVLYATLIPLAYAAIPLYIYFFVDIDYPATVLN